MFFKKAFNNFNHWWRYVIVIIAVSVGYFVGQFPFLLAVVRSIGEDESIGSDKLDQFLANPDFSLVGINSNMGFALLLMMFVGALTAFFFIFKPLHRREFRTLVTTKSSINWNKIFFGFLVFLGLGLILELVIFFMHPGDYYFQFDFKMFIPLLILSAFLLPVQTSFEELIFRGYFLQGIAVLKVNSIINALFSLSVGYGLYNYLNNHAIFNSIDDLYKFYILLAIAIFLSVCIFLIVDRLIKNFFEEKNHWLNKNYKIFPIIITAVLFGLVHSMNPEIEKFGYGIMQTYYISAGLMLAIVTVMDDSLELALGIHAATNFTGAVFIGYENAAVQTESLFVHTNLSPYVATIGFIIISIIFILIAKFKYKWGSFVKIFEQIDQSEDIV